MKYLLLLPLLLLASCNNQPSQVELVEESVYTQFYVDYSDDDYELITLKTSDIRTNYYLTDVYYRQVFENNIYTTKYITGIGDKMVSREISK